MFSFFCWWKWMLDPSFCINLVSLLVIMHNTYALVIMLVLENIPNCQIFGYLVILFGWSLSYQVYQEKHLPSYINSTLLAERNTKEGVKCAKVREGAGTFSSGLWSQVPSRSFKSWWMKCEIKTTSLFWKTNKNLLRNSSYVIAHLKAVYQYLQMSFTWSSLYI